MSANFSKLVSDPRRSEAFWRFITQEAESGNLGPRNRVAMVIQNLANAVREGYLPDYLSRYTGSWQILDRINDLVSRIG